MQLAHTPTFKLPNRKNMQQKNSSDHVKKSRRVLRTIKKDFFDKKKESKILPMLLVDFEGFFCVYLVLKCFLIYLN